MSHTYFRLEINDVKNPEGETAYLDLTEYTNKENMLDDLAEKLNCQKDELDFDDAYIDAEEDFLLDLLDVNDVNDIEDSTFDNISEIENSGYSLDLIKAGKDILSSSDSFDNVMSYVRNNYIGEYKSNADFAESYCEDYMNVSIPNILFGCVDWDKVWETSLSMDHSESDGHYFRN